MSIAFGNSQFLAYVIFSKRSQATLYQFLYLLCNYFLIYISLSIYIYIYIYMKGSNRHEIFFNERKSGQILAIRTEKMLEQINVFSQPRVSHMTVSPSISYIMPSSHHIDSAVSNYSRGCPRGVMVKAMDSGIVVLEFVLQSRYTFTFGQIPLGKVRTPLSSQLWVKKYHFCSSRRIALALNNLQRLICH